MFHKILSSKNYFRVLVIFCVLIPSIINAQNVSEDLYAVKDVEQDSRVKQSKVEVILDKDNYEIGDEIVVYVILSDLIEVDSDGKPQLRKMSPEQLDGLFVLKNKKSAIAAVELADANTKKPCIEKQKKSISIDAPIAIINTIALVDCKKPLTSVLISKDGELPVTNNVKVSNDSNGLSGERKVGEVVESNDNMIQSMDRSDNNFSIKLLVVIFGGIFLFGLIAFLAIQKIYRD